LAKAGDGVIGAEDLGLDDQGPGDVYLPGLAVLFQPETPIDPEPGGAGTSGTGVGQAVPGRSKGKIFLDFISFISRL
jgi:hypothetical protein